MAGLLRFLFLITCFCWVSTTAAAAPVFAVDLSDVTVCPAEEADTAPPRPDGPGCEDQSIFSLNPQNTHIWAFLKITVDTVPEEPLGLYLYAKASSHAFLNGEKVGENGEPGDAKASEKAGKMDVIFPLRPGQLRPGDNEIALRMSSHAGPVNLMSPIHGVFITNINYPQNIFLRRYWRSVLPFGAFALGFLYFLTMALSGRQRVTSALLAGLSFIAGAQLFSETSRGLFAYPYWFHDWRLILIATCSAAFGLCLSVYVILRFRPERKWLLIAGSAFAAIAPLILNSGFDAKASYALLYPTILAALIALSRVRDDFRPSLAFGGSLALFALINVVGQGQFLDAWFYYAVAALLVFLFAQQAGAFAREADLRREEQARAEKLQYILDQKETAETPVTLTIKSAGRMHRVLASEIVFVKGAGDYSELVLGEGETHLHGATMAELESELPAYFLRIHRSYLVNTNLIASLERAQSGTGELKLTNGDVLPVSRRIMPTVRQALQ